jgi:X-Pro dipeptidyl-peptidase
LPRKTLIGPVLALVLAAGVGGIAAAKPAPTISVKNGLTQPVFSYTDAIREHVYVESSVDSDGDGKNDLVNVDIVRPKETAQGLKVPVIMDESPYYDNLGRGNEGQRKTYDANGNPLQFPLYYDNYFVPRGYAFLAVDMIGTTRSDGCPTTGGASDVLGGKAVVDWLNGRAKAFTASGQPVTASWTTGHVGMIGKSYDGTLANAVAATGVKGLDTIVPISAISSWYDYTRKNGVLYARDYAEYLAGLVDTHPAAGCAAVLAKMATDEDDATGNYNAFWAERDYRHGTIGQVSEVHASVFAVHGLNDLNVKPDNFSSWWAGLRVEKKAWLSQRGHVDPFDFRRSTWVDTLHAWFDHYLYKLPAKVALNADVETAPDTWQTQPTWPSRSVNVSLRPEADGSLGLTPAASGSTASYGDIPGSDETGTTESDMVTDPGTEKAYRLAYVSAPIPKTFRVSGTPAVKLKAKFDKTDAHLTALLVDYGADTRIDYLGAGSGISTLTTRDCWGESTSYDSACYLQTQTKTVQSPLNIVARGWMDTQHRTSLTRQSPTTPGAYYGISWQTLPQDYIFKAGHRIALVLGGTESINDNNDSTPTGTQVTVDLAGTSITIPVVIGGPGSSVVPKATSHWQGPAKVNLPHQSHDLR